MIEMRNERRECAERWITLVNEFEEIRNESPPSTVLRRLAWRSRRWIFRQRYWKRLAALAREFEQTTRRAERLFVGAEPRSWGVLSGGELDRSWRRPSIRLEDTLREIASNTEGTA